MNFSCKSRKQRQIQSTRCLCANFTTKIYGCRRGIPQTKGIRRKGKGNLGGDDNIKGDVKNQDKVR